jgi:NADH-quinone oxidoreductase subunit E
MSSVTGSPEGAALTGLDSRPFETEPERPPLPEQARLEAREIIARYPQARSALLPMLHLVQSYQGYVTPEGLAFCAEELGLTKAEVSAVATFYTMYKRRPTGRHIVSVCTNTLCNVLGGQRIFDALSEDLGVHHDETAADGSVTLEHAECLAACDYAPVVTVDYEFYDQQDVESARALVAALRRGEKPHPSRGAPLSDFRGISRQLAGFSQWDDDAAADAAVDAEGELGPTLIGVRLAAQRGESAPFLPGADRPAPRPGTARAGAPEQATRPSGDTGRSPGKEAADETVAAADNPAERSGAAQAHPDAPEPEGRELADSDGGTETPAGREPGTGTTPPTPGPRSRPGTERKG